MTAKIEMAGQKYGMLTAIERVEKHGQYFLWKCICDCGKIIIRTQPALRTGGTLSCGCRKQIINSGNFKRTHGHTDKSQQGQYSKEYGIWSGIKSRTSNPKAHAYERYGAVGIKMCGDWLHSFELFFSCVGTAPSSKHTIDRVDNTKGYEPGNVKWATYTEQNRHRKCTIFIEIDGIKKSLGDWCDQYGISFNVAYMRITRYGWEPLRGLQTPVRKVNR